MRILLVGVLCIFMESKVFAAIPIQQAGAEKLNRYIDQGVVVGGFDKGDQILHSLRTHYDKDSKVERVVLDLSAFKKSHSNAERPGFFHISVQKKLKRILLSLENVSENKMDQKKLEQILLKSNFISSGQLYVDGAKKNLTIALDLKKDAKVEIFELTGYKQNGRIVMDIK